MGLFKSLGGLFGRRASEYVDEPQPKKASDSEARNTFYEDLDAQAAERARGMIMGDDKAANEEVAAMVKAIIPRRPDQFAVVRQGDDSKGDVAEAATLTTGNGMAVAQDEYPAGAVQQPSGGKIPEQLDRIERGVDFYQVYGRINPRILRHFVSRAFIGYPACTILGQHEVIGLCCAMPPEDAIAPGFTVFCVSSDHKKTDKHIENETQWLQEMHDLAVDEGVCETCIKFGTYKRLYGIGIAIPRVKLKKDHTFEEPYDPSLIEPESFKGFTIIDPSRVCWDFDAETIFDPLSEWYQKPEFLRLMTVADGNREDLGGERRMHRSWCITANYREVGEDLLATYMYGGQPLSQILFERVFCADTLANEIVALAMSKRTLVMEVDKKKVLAEPKKVEHFLQRLNYFRTNNSAFLREPGTQVTQLETSLADLQPLSAQQYQYCAAYAGIPMTKLFKNVPSGLQATGQYEVEDYEQTIKPIRKDNQALINRWFEMKIASEYPDRADLRVRVKFNPFIPPKAAEVQQMASQKASMVCQLTMNNVVTIAEARKLLMEGENDVFNVLSAETPELLAQIQSLKDPEKQQQLQMQMQGAMGGMGGAIPPNPGAQGAEQHGQGQKPPEHPLLAENKGVFTRALEEVIGDKGNGGQQPAAGEGQPERPAQQEPQGQGEGERPPAAQPGGGAGSETPQTTQPGLFASALSTLEEQPSPAEGR